MGRQAGRRAPTEGLLAPEVLPLATRPGLELQFRDDPVDPVVVGSDPNVDPWVVPAGAALAPADHPSLQPRLAHEAYQWAPRVTLRGKQRHRQEPSGRGAAVQAAPVFPSCPGPPHWTRVTISLASPDHLPRSPQGVI